MASHTSHDPAIRDQARLIYDTVRLLKTRIIADHMNYMATHGGEMEGMELTIPQMNMLSVIRERQPITLKQIASNLQVSAPSASGMVDRLVEMNAVTRSQNPADRREVVVEITPEASDALGRLEEQLIVSIAELVERIGPDYARQWCDVYARLREILQPEISTNFESTPEGSDVA